MNLSITIKMGPLAEKNDCVEYAFEMNQLGEQNAIMYYNLLVLSYKNYATSKAMSNHFNLCCIF